jgi:hypothetical protein
VSTLQEREDVRKKNAKRLRIAKRVKAMGLQIKIDNLDTDETECMVCEDKEKLGKPSEMQLQL